MNPLNYIDAYEKQVMSEIVKAKVNQNKISYTDVEVMEIIKTVSAKARNAVYNGEFIFNLENVENQTITVDDNTFNMKKILSKSDGFILVLQMIDVPEGDMNASDLDILSQQISQAVKNAKNVEGVLILPPNFEISLLTAKTNIKGYENQLFDLSDDDLKELEDYMVNKIGKTYRAMADTLQLNVPPLMPPPSIFTEDDETVKGITRYDVTGMPVMGIRGQIFKSFDEE